jgi:hypothetical protein
MLRIEAGNITMAPAGRKFESAQRGNASPQEFVTVDSAAGANRRVPGAAGGQFAYTRKAVLGGVRGGVRGGVVAAASWRRRTRAAASPTSLRQSMAVRVAFAALVHGPVTSDVPGRPSGSQLAK